LGDGLRRTVDLFRLAGRPGGTRALAEDDCISSTPGTVTILDPDRLHAHLCDC
jgi:hypothetical protein